MFIYLIESYIQQTLLNNLNIHHMHYNHLHSSHAPSMGFRRVLVSLFVSFLLAVEGGDYITWRDFTVGEGLNSRKWWDASDRSGIILVDPDGAGDSKTVQGAIDLVPENNSQRVKVILYPAVYREKVLIPKNKPYISLIGNEDDPSLVKITWNDKASNKSEHGGQLGTWNSASVTVLSDYFCAKGLTFENMVVQDLAGVNGYQAVAFRIGGDRAAFFKVRFLGYQDTLLDEKGTHYFLNCFIQGSTDFVFGNAKSLYQDCSIAFVGKEYAVAAHHRNSARENTGFSFVNSTITGAGEIYLGRAWGNYSRIVYSYCEFHVQIRPGGWDDWKIPARQKTAEFAEYECRGKGADRSTRAKWSKELTYTEAMPFLTTSFIDGEEWLRL